MRYVRGHAMRGRYQRTGIRASDYLIEDRGFATPCWVWQLTINNNGYGTCSALGRAWKAHRFAWRERHGVTPPGPIDHLCRVRACVNPDHLQIVSPVENQERSPLVTRLSHDDVRAIRASDLPSPALAQIYGIDPSYAWRVKVRQKRAHVPDA